MAVARPGKIVGVGRNYGEHAAELGHALPTQPLLFLKPATAVIGDGDTILLPAESACRILWPESSRLRLAGDDARAGGRDRDRHARRRLPAHGGRRRGGGDSGRRDPAESGRA
jgi:hypothetical protein